MKKLGILTIIFCAIVSSQTAQDTAAIRRAALDYIESQHNPNPQQMANCLHPRFVKRTFWKDDITQREFILETTSERMEIVAESYNKNDDKFPSKPRKDVKLLDISERTASVKLFADDWIDYMHLIKINGAWKIINVLWQYYDTSKHQ